MSLCEQLHDLETGLPGTLCGNRAVTQVVLMSRPRNWWKRKRRWKVTRIAINCCKPHIVWVRPQYDPATWPIEAKIPLVTA